MDEVDNTTGTPTAGNGPDNGFSLLNPDTAMEMYLKNQIMTDIRMKTEAESKGEEYIPDARAIIRY